MHIPESFREERSEVLFDLNPAHPLGLLITAGQEGFVATSLPFLIYAGEGKHSILRAHLARANSHWRALQDVAWLRRQLDYLA